MFDSLGSSFNSDRMFGDIQDADSAYQVRGPRNVRAPIPMAVNGRAANIVDVLSNADALGLIPDAYRDIKQIGSLLDEVRKDDLLAATRERLQADLGIRKLPTPQALGAREVWATGADGVTPTSWIKRTCWIDISTLFARSEWQKMEK